MVSCRLGERLHVIEEDTPISKSLPFKQNNTHGETDRQKGRKTDREIASTILINTNPQRITQFTASVPSLRSPERAGSHRRGWPSESPLSPGHACAGIILMRRVSCRTCYQVAASTRIRGTSALDFNPSPDLLSHLRDIGSKPLNPSCLRGQQAQGCLLLPAG